MKQSATLLLILGGIAFSGIGLILGAIPSSFDVTPHVPFYSLILYIAGAICFGYAIHMNLRKPIK